MRELPIVIAVYAGYATLKFLGYCLAALLFRKVYSRPDIAVWKVGLARTLLGILVGGLYTGAWALLESQGAFHELPMAGGRAGSLLWYLVALAPVRIFEWGLLIWFFFDRRWERIGRDAACVFAGTLWSYVLDLPAIIGIATVISSIC